MRGIVMTQKPPVPGDGSSSGPTSGFQAKIKGASLADLIQMECLAGSKLVVRVTSGSKVGHLYFRGGSVVHAVTPTSSGEPAAMEMLGWNGGTFEPADREWSQDTISTSWQNLLLREAQIRDEKQMGSVVALRADGAEGRAAARTEHAPIGESIEFDVTPLQVAGHTLRSEDFQLFVRMSRDGTVVDSHGCTQAFADTVAYALQLSQLVGDQLGFERFSAMECAFKSSRCFVVLQADGEVVVLEPHAAADSTSLRELLGL
jgi:Domain of unknown function (DUF4388)